MSHRLDDKKIHEIIDRLNPSLRSVDNIDGKIRKREFYALSKEEAYGVFVAMATIHDCLYNLKLHLPTKNEAEDEKTAEIIRQKSPNKDFYTMGLKEGDEIFLIKNPELKAVICSENKVSYNGEEPTTITHLSNMLFEKFNLGIPYLGGFEYFAYDNAKESLYLRYNRMVKERIK